MVGLVGPTASLQMEKRNIPDLAKNQILFIWSVASQFTD